jgi:UDP-glucuronate 4-epimerase
MGRQRRTIVTGVAGFIGSHVAHRLLEAGRPVLGVDVLGEDEDAGLRRARLARLTGREGFEFIQLDLCDADAVQACFQREPGCTVLHLAARSGVRRSAEHPREYTQSNLVAFGEVLEGCRVAGAAHLVFASSSSVYGANARLPSSVETSVDHPLSFYAATKRANELMAHAYAHQHGLPCTGLRLFTVYGPWGRTDMAPYLFTRAILEGRPIDVFHEGRARRDFTYVDDVVEGMLRVAERPAAPDPGWSGENPHPARSSAPFRLYNLGNGRPVELGRFIALLEQLLGRPAHTQLKPTRAGEVEATDADVTELERDLGFRPGTPLETGLARYVEWFRAYYGL